MATSFFFNNYESFQKEQQLLNNLAEEMIKIHGMNILYIPRTRNGVDPLFGEASNSSFDNAILIEMYLNNFSGFGGNGDMMSKFGLMVGDTLTMSVGRRRFDEEIGRQYEMARPQEGDLLYFPFTQGIFEIKFVEHESTFYQTGALQVFELRCEKFNYSGEAFNTGIAEIDQVFTKYSTGSSNFELLTQDGYCLSTEDGDEIVKEEYGQDNPLIGEENEFFQSTANTFIDWTVKDPFSETGFF